LIFGILAGTFLVVVLGTLSVRACCRRSCVRRYSSDCEN
jgi:hypothetical protein